jgi:hypothetical protein
MRRRLSLVLAAVAMVVLAVALPGASRQASATDWCAGGVCQEWVARYDGPASGSDVASALAVDGSGNVYITGYSPGSGTGRDYATVKYDAGGVQQWASRYDGPANGDDVASALAVDGSGNVYVTGESEGSGTGNDYATVKYNAAGVQQWVARYNGPAGSDDWANALAVDGSGNVYVTGGSLGSGTGYDYATVKYNASGAQQWASRYNGPASGPDVPNALAVDGSGNVYVTGFSAGSGTSSDYATVKYNASGAQQWVARYDGPTSGFDVASALAVDGSGNVYVTGLSAGSGTGYDYATVKYNASGAQQWASRYDGPASGDDYARALAVDGLGNVYVTGYSLGSGTGNDYATVKYNASGAQQWASRYNGPASGDDQANALAVDGSGNVYVTGRTGSVDPADYATVGYDASGAQQWAALYDGPASDYDEAHALAVDGSGNVYVTGESEGLATSSDYATVKYHTPVLNRLGGQYNSAGFSGDGHAALDAQLDHPHGLYETGTGSSLYLADTGNNRIRKIAGDGTITTVAGGGAGCVEPCSATDQSLNEPYDVFVDAAGNIYLADTGNNRIRKVTTGGTITTVAGGGAGCVEPCQATQQSLNGPRGVAVDEAGNIYIADTENHAIRKVDAPSGNITTIAGDGTQGYSGDGGPATAAQLNRPHDVYPYGPMYAGTTDLLIADTDNNVIRWLYGPSGIINTLAGGGGGCDANHDAPYDGCPAIQAQLNAPEAVAADASLAVFVADTQNNLIRRFAPGDTIISTLAGGGNGCAANGTEPYYGCPATDAKLNDPAGVAAGSLIIADSGSATLSDLDLPSSEPGGSFGNAASCSGGVATADWVFVVFALGLILARSRVSGLLLVRIRGVTGLSRRPGTTG